MTPAEHSTPIQPRHVLGRNGEHSPTRHGESLDLCLSALRARRWHMWAYGNDPVQAFGATLTWPHVVDMIILWSPATALAYRTPRHPDTDPYCPTHVTGHYTGPALWATRWLLTITPPGNTLSALRPVGPDFAALLEMRLHPEKTWVPLPPPGPSDSR
ncbi:hypothetical protein [Actinokineospora iranica]|uniref:Uncharacterized protein n=1 Tax=Actinokineospora iranica TaxID=1271860 RepID=A0A1G6P909_9PSEU|nr:hypothetical protein [Actinokineospora iranica]SDC75907.1 hypothetical protein SAMN05216174_104148 [Actinokineospora iranica]